MAGAARPVGHKNSPRHYLKLFGALHKLITAAQPVLSVLSHLLPWRRMVLYCKATQLVPPSEPSCSEGPPDAQTGWHVRHLTCLPLRVSPSHRTARQAFTAHPQSMATPRSTCCEDAHPTKVSLWICVPAGGLRASICESIQPIPPQARDVALRSASTYCVACSAGVASQTLSAATTRCTKALTDHHRNQIDEASCANSRPACQGQARVYEISPMPLRSDTSVPWMSGQAV